jgi:hypothetical protein
MWLGSLELFGPMVLGDTFNIIVPITKIFMDYCHLSNITKLTKRKHYCNVGIFMHNLQNEKNP